MLFKLKIGTHQQGTKFYKAGDVIDTDRDLCKMFKNKFEDVTNTQAVATPPRSAPVIPSIEDVEDVDKSPVKQPVDVTTLGKEVSSSFGLTETSGYRVFKGEDDLFSMVETKTGFLSASGFSANEATIFLKSNNA